MHAQRRVEARGGEHAEALDDAESLRGHAKWEKPENLAWDNLERVKVTIICEAMALVLSGEYEEAGA